MTGPEPVILPSLEPLVAALRADGRRVIAPTVRDGAIVLAEIASAAELPYGWGVALAAGRYQLRRRSDRAAFGHAAGPGSWKSWLHPARGPLFSARRNGDGTVTVTEPPAPAERYAFLGVRPCDLRAIATQRRVLTGGQFPDTDHETRCHDTFVVAVNCTEPGDTCFCASAGGGPRAGTGFDIALTELDGPRYLAEAGSDAGERILAMVPAEPAGAEVVSGARAAVDAAGEKMGRSLPAGDLRRLLADRVGSTAWDEVAVTGDVATVTARPLTWDGRRLRLGVERTERATVALDGTGLAVVAHPGDNVSLHWNWVCDVLRPDQVVTLRRITGLILALTNDALRRPVAAAVLG